MIIILVLSLHSSIHSQNDELDLIISQLELQEDKAQSAFLWVVNNIEYDVERLRKKKERIIQRK